MENTSKVLEFYPHKTFYENGKIYIYCINNAGLFEIDDRTDALIKQEGNTFEEAYEKVKSIFSIEEFNRIITEMKENLFIKDDENDKTLSEKRNIKSNNNIFSVTIMLIQECNMRCRYCFGEGGEYYDKGSIDIKTAKKAIDFLIENSGDHKNLSVVLFGGEPLLAFPIIKELVPYIRENEIKFGKKIEINMTTNGTLITPEIEKYLIENQIHTQISIDGDKDTQDYNRYFVNKKGSYDTVIKRTENMRRENLLSARATLTGKQLDLLHTFDHLDSLGFHSVAIAPASNLLSSDDFNNLIPEEIKFVKEFETLVKNSEYAKAKKMKIVVADLRRIHNGSIRLLPCGVGRHMYAVDIHGNLFPCHRFVSEKEYKIGDIFEGATKRNEFLNEIQLSNHDKCSTCWAQNLCSGNCPNENLVLTGKTTGSAEKICKFIRAKFNELIHIYLRLSPEEKENIFSNVKKRLPQNDDVKKTLNEIGHGVA